MDFDKKINEKLRYETIKKETALSLNSAGLFYVYMVNFLSLISYLLLINNFYF